MQSVYQKEAFISYLMFYNKTNQGACFLAISLLMYLCQMVSQELDLMLFFIISISITWESVYVRHKSSDEWI